MIRKEVSRLRKKFLDYACFIGQMLQRLCESFEKKDQECLRALISQDEPEVNETEIEIDKLCMNIIAKFQPKGKSLRIIMMISKINNDLERIADQIVNISQSGITLFRHYGDSKIFDFSDIFARVIQMYEDSIHSFHDEDSDLAKKVLQQDDYVDTFNRKIYEKFKDEMEEDRKEITYALQVIRVAKNLERIADHSTNICEDVVYVVEGRVLKHGK